jgi:hypothetical protein
MPLATQQRPPRSLVPRHLSPRPLRLPQLVRRQPLLQALVQALVQVQVKVRADILLVHTALGVVTPLRVGLQHHLLPMVVLEEATTPLAVPRHHQLVPLVDRMVLVQVILILTVLAVMEVILHPAQLEQSPPDQPWLQQTQLSRHTHHQTRTSRRFYRLWVSWLTGYDRFRHSSGRRRNILSRITIGGTDYSCLWRCERVVFFS